MQQILSELIIVHFLSLTDSNFHRPKTKQYTILLIINILKKNTMKNAFKITIFSLRHFLINSACKGNKSGRLQIHQKLILLRQPKPPQTQL